MNNTLLAAEEHPIGLIRDCHVEIQRSPLYRLLAEENQELADQYEQAYFEIVHPMLERSQRLLDLAAHQPLSDAIIR